jgi:gamma-butyrobetaine dioxygenase
VADQAALAGQVGGVGWTDRAVLAEAPANGAGSAEQSPLGWIPASWLRANCPCTACLDPGTGQRLVAITDQPASVSVGVLEAAPGSVTVRFEPDGHMAVLSASWLAEARTMAAGSRGGAADDRTEDAKRLWRAADLACGPPEGTWPGYTADPRCRARCLESLLTTGFVLLRDVPPEPGMVLKVAASMGYVRETNYGKLFDVRVTADPANLAFTARAIGPHTDNPYRDPAPTVQLLHCLASAAEGGDSALVDGFAAAAILRDRDRSAFSVLTSTPVTFGYADATADLQAHRPVIAVSATGLVRQIRFNNRSMRPLRPGPGQDWAEFAPTAQAFYAAYRSFAEILLLPELTLAFSMRPGDCLVFDNTRILHARTAFTGAGDRHLQGCYADLDGVASSLAVLRRTNPASDARDASDISQASERKPT